MDGKQLDLFDVGSEDEKIQERLKALEETSKNIKYMQEKEREASRTGDTKFTLYRRILRGCMNDYWLIESGIPEHLRPPVSWKK